MPNPYKTGQGGTPTVCYGSPIPPDLGNTPQGGPAPFQFDMPMVSVANPYRPCGPPTCPATSCCGGGSNGGGGASGGSNNGGGGMQNGALAF